MIDVSKLQEGDEIVYVGKRTCCRVGKTYKVCKADSSQCFFVICDRGSDDHHYITPTNQDEWNRFIQHKGGWIGVDLDGTLAVYDGWKGPYDIGPPIPAMVERVKKWIAEGREVRIFTARVTERDKNEDGTEHDLFLVRKAIQEWSNEHIGHILSITNVKDWNMMELWDDRAVQVRPNTGMTLADELEAIRSADAGKVATP